MSSSEDKKAAAPYKIWGGISETDVLDQMNNAASLPVSVRGALMPDAHLGYGLPIGGVLATKDAVVPYAVGMDIACRMKISILDMPIKTLDIKENKLIKAIERETRFGLGSKFDTKRNHSVMDRDWSVSPPTKSNKQLAWSQLGSSGSGNHFAEFGELELEQDDLNLPAGKYLALLSHSGSRKTGGEVAQYYSKLAKKLNPDLPKELAALAWLDINSDEGREYWAAMTLMGHYAAANHQLIHEGVTRRLGAEVIAEVENHHNFAWKEEFDGEELIVHRKGATPASINTLGVIPGSMGDPAYIVRGLGNPDSLNSASHGAGRKMSRKKAKKLFKWSEARKYLQQRRVHLLSAGLDEVPMAYKNIEKVMDAQSDLVQKVARFKPRLVKMAD